MTGDPTTGRDATGMTAHAFTSSQAFTSFQAFTSSGDVPWTSADPYLSGNFAGRP